MPTTVSPLRAARHQRRLTIRDVAEQLGVSERTVLRWELGQVEMSGRDLLRVARLLRRRPEAIYQEDGAA